MDRYVLQVRTRSIPDSSREEAIPGESEEGLASRCLVFFVFASYSKLVPREITMCIAGEEDEDLRESVNEINHIVEAIILLMPYLIVTYPSWWADP